MNPKEEEKSKRQQRKDEKLAEAEIDREINRRRQSIVDNGRIILKEYYSESNSD